MVNWGQMYTKFLKDVKKRKKDPQPCILKEWIRSNARKLGRQLEKDILKKP